MSDVIAYLNITLPNPNIDGAEGVDSVSVTYPFFAEEDVERHVPCIFDWKLEAPQGIASFNNILSNWQSVWSLTLKTNGKIFFKVFCSASSQNHVTILDGGGLINVQRVGSYEHIVKESLVFNKTKTAQLKYWYDSPAVDVFRSTLFFDEKGAVVEEQPTYNPRKGEFSFKKEVYGQLFVAYQTSYMLIAAEYAGAMIYGERGGVFAAAWSANVAGEIFIPEQNRTVIMSPSGLETVTWSGKWAAEEFRPFPLFNTEIPRTTFSQKKTEDYVTVYRVFPTPPFSTVKIPPPDPATQRTDYIDQEVVTSETFDSYQNSGYGSVLVASNSFNYAQQETPENAIVVNSYRRTYDENGNIIGYS